MKKFLLISCLFLLSVSGLRAQNPTANFTYTAANLSCLFSDLSTGCSGFTYLWSFGDGNTSTFPNPTHTYASQGTYLVCLTVTDNCGTDSTCQSVTVPPCPTPQAGMLTSVNGLQVTFTDFSSGNPTSWLWQFGDGNQSTAQNPVHTYATGGTYMVCLGVQSACGFDSTCQSVTVQGSGTPPTSNFVFCGNNLAVNFTYVGSGATSYAWDFGDGNSSTMQNPSHTYASAGTYLVCLIATNASGSDTTCLAVALPCTPVVAGFSSNPSGLSVGFTDQSSGTPLLWTWDFGDGNTSSAQNPTHTYTNGGTYTVCLIALNACCADTICQTVTVSGCAGPPTAGFTTVSTGLVVNFTDISTGGASSWGWDFGDGNSSTAQNPTHTYASASTYTICLIATNACGSDTTCQTITVNCLAPTASFTQSLNGQVVTFTDLSSQAPTAWFWDFGDGNSSSQQNPVHTYGISGTYTVCLTVQNACGIDSVCQSVNTNCPTPNVNFLFAVNNLTVTFTDQTGNNPTGWTWDFGDGSSASQQNPVHTYATPGTFIACLTSTNTCGQDSSCRIINLSCPTPSANFVAAPNNNVVVFTDNSTGTPSGWQWDFGDGNTSTMQHPTHTYTQPGTYTICLTVIDSCGNHTTCQSQTITCPQPTSGFSYIGTSVWTFVFTDSSTNGTSWFWNFGDGSTSTMQNPQHTFPGNGTYLVCVTSSNGCLSSTTCKNVTVLCPKPSASFSHTLTGNTITFTNTTSGGANPTWLWDFGDGNFSSSMNPTHTYPSQGNWTTCLFATDSCGTDTFCTLTSTIGIEDEITGAQIEVWPNPTHSQVNLKIDAKSSSEIRVEVYDPIGAKTLDAISCDRCNGFSHEFDISRHARGTYFIMVEVDGHRTFRKLTKL